jgi:hypothetical protein
VAQLGKLDLATPAGLASLSAILGQVLQSGLNAGQAAREEETRRSAEQKTLEKKRKRDERRQAGVLSPHALETIVIEFLKPQ